MKQLFPFLLILLLSCSTPESNKIMYGLPFFNSAEFTPEWITKVNKEYGNIHTISPFALLNQNGDTITNKNLNGHIYVADFFFTTCPGLCPRLGKSMKTLQDSLIKEDVLLVSHTVMPSHDSVAVLKLYAESNEVVSGKWHLLTGEKEAIYKLARESYFADEDFIKTQQASDFIHTENFILIDQKGRIRGVYNGTLQLEMIRLLKHIRLLQKDTD
ncbi:MAG: protein SCO1/2 [Glaciecola sp.]|jgi:protein SCO1/2